MKLFYKMGVVVIRFLYWIIIISYFVNNHGGSTIQYTEDDIIKILDFVIDDLFVELKGLV